MHDLLTPGRPAADFPARSRRTWRLVPVGRASATSPTSTVGLTSRRPPNLCAGGSSAA